LPLQKFLIFTLQVGVTLLRFGERAAFFAQGLFEIAKSFPEGAEKCPPQGARSQHRLRLPWR